MATRSLISLRGFIESLPGGYKSINPADLTNLTPPQEEEQLQLASGDNVINVSELALGCLIIFGSNSITVKTIKGDGADIGIPVTRNGWFVLTFHQASPPNSFYINSDAVDEVGETAVYTRIIWF